MDTSKPFGLRIVKKDQAFRPKTTGIFGSDTDDDTPPNKKTSKIPQAKPKLWLKSENIVDPSIFEYDAIYDDMKAKQVAEIAPKVKKNSRYIDNLLKAADKRKKEYERRVEKKVQLEREKEGDEFEDKEMFVTSAYKKKLQEREEEEERERHKNQLNDMMDVTKQKDLSGFYRHFLKQSVGEEKIPEFGENVTVKKEQLSDNDEKQTHNTPKDSPSKADLFPEDKDYSDSDNSSAEESGHDGENSYEKSIREYRKRPNKESSDEDIPSVKSKKSNKHKSHPSGRENKFDDLQSSKLHPRSKNTSEEKNYEPSHDSSKEHKKTKTSDSEEMSKNASKKLKSDPGTKNSNAGGTCEKDISSKVYRKRNRSSESSGSDSSVYDEKSLSTNNFESQNTQKKFKSGTATQSSSDKETDEKNVSSKSHNKNKDNSESSGEETDSSDNEKSKGMSCSKNGKVADNIEKTNAVKLRNIYEKRCVGDLFSTAQAKYFQRLAARSSA